MPEKLKTWEDGRTVEPLGPISSYRMRTLGAEGKKPAFKHADLGWGGKTRLSAPQPAPFL